MVQTTETSYRNNQHRDAAAACLPPGGRNTYPGQTESFVRDMVAIASESEKTRLQRLETEKQEKIAREEAEQAAALELEQKRAREAAEMQALLAEQEQESQGQSIVVGDDSEDEVWQEDIKNAKKKRKSATGRVKQETNVKRLKSEPRDHSLSVIMRNVCRPQVATCRPRHMPSGENTCKAWVLGWPRGEPGIGPILQPKVRALNWFRVLEIGVTAVAARRRNGCGIMPLRTSAATQPAPE